ncbi:MAG: hypothetical protein MUE56_10300 [Ignavibacteria bacterium]|nr:hypothetical protein [Ignavibacteria bacterium]
MIGNLKPIIFLAIIATAIGYLFNIGQTLQYTTDSNYNTGTENVGLLGSGSMYAPGIVLGLLPLLIKIQRRKIDRIFLIIGAALLYLFILLNVRRTAIIIPILGLLGFFIYIPSKAKVKILEYILVIAIGLVLSYPLYSKVLTRRFEYRETQGRFEKGFYKTEGRYLEAVKMFEDISTLDEPLKVFFGIGNNIFATQYEDGVAVRRMTHSDIPLIFEGMGIFGLILYLFVYLSILREILSIPSTGVFRDLKAACFGLLFISVFVSINGSISLFSFRALNFLLLGAFMGYSRKLMFDNGELHPDKAEKS